MAKDRLVLCGLPLAREVFRRLDPALRFRRLRAEGSFVRAGTAVARVEGRAASILTGERTALNFLQHLSGIATFTRRCVQLSRGRCRIRDTRKTHPGLRELEKYAVRIGGGENHRLRLDDGILIKHNHWRISGGVAESVRRARRADRTRPIQVEVSTLRDLREAIEAGADGVLLDNLSPRQVRRALDLARRRFTSKYPEGSLRVPSPASRPCDRMRCPWVRSPTPRPGWIWRCGSKARTSDEDSPGIPASSGSSWRATLRTPGPSLFQHRLDQ
jgi:nicotinate-nucleotide pyrophosphorylase (carboxylating)